MLPFPLPRWRGLTPHAIILLFGILLLGCQQASPTPVLNTTITAACSTKEPAKAAQVWRGLDHGDPAMLDSAYDASVRPSMAKAAGMIAQWVQYAHPNVEYVASCKGDAGVWSFYVWHSTKDGSPNDVAFEIATNLKGDVEYFSW